MADVNEIISKSLDELDAVMEGLNKSTAASADDLAKGMGNDNVPPEDVSEDTPEDEQQGEGEENTPPEEGEGNEPAQEGEGDSDTEPDNDEDDEVEGEDTEKSFHDGLSSNDSVKKALEVSEFLGELVKSIGAHIDGQRADITKSIEAINKSIGASDNTTMLLAKSFQGIAKSQKVVMETQAELMKSVNGLSKRLKALEAQPQVRKSVSSNTQVLDKSFKSSLGQASTGSEKLNKSQALSILNAEFVKGNTTLGADIVLLESSGSMDILSDNAKALLNNR